MGCFIKKKTGVVIAKPSLVTGEWSVPVQDNRDGGVKVFINLIYVKYTTVYHDRYYKYTKKNVPQAFSTGTLEKLLFENIG
jgi:hypothetical protein